MYPSKHTAMIASAWSRAVRTDMTFPSGRVSRAVWGRTLGVALLAWGINQGVGLRRGGSGFATQAGT